MFPILPKFPPNGKLYRVLSSSSCMAAAVSQRSDDIGRVCSQDTVRDNAAQEFSLANADFRVSSPNLSENGLPDVGEGAGVRLEMSLFCKAQHDLPSCVVALSGLNDHDVPDLIGRLQSGPHAERAEGARLSHAELHDFIEDACARGARLESKLGSTAAEVCDAYVERLAFPQVRYKDLTPAPEGAKDPENERFRWVHIQHPTVKVLSRIAADLGMTEGAIEQCLKTDQAPSTYESGKNLIVLAEEFHARPDSPYGMDIIDITAILTKNALITMSRGRSEAVERVWQEAATKESLAPEDSKNSNALFSRILGSILKVNLGATSSLRQAASGLAYAESTKTPSKCSMVDLMMLEQTVSRTSFSLNCMRTVLASLQTPSALFGLQRPKEQLQRHQVPLVTAVGHLGDAKQFAASVRSNWSTNQGEIYNDSVYGLSKVAIWFLPPSFTCYVLSLGIVNSWLAPAMQWAALAVSLLASSALHFAFRRHKT